MSDLIDALRRAAWMLADEPRSAAKADSLLIARHAKTLADMAADCRTDMANRGVHFTEPGDHE